MQDLVARVRLTALWAALMLLYLYADFFSLFPQGHIEEIMSGKMGPFDVSQTSLFLASLLMALPALMVALTPLLPLAACRWATPSAFDVMTYGSASAVPAAPRKDRRARVSDTISPPGRWVSSW